MTGVPDEADPWAWARAEEPDEATQDAYAKVTAVVVAHNAEQWLRRLLESLAAQRLRPRRIVVADADSTDSTREILSQALARGRVDSVVATDAGASFGAGVARALGEDDDSEWLWLLHDDMVADPEALNRLVASALRGPDVVAPLLVESRRQRRPAGRVSEAGQTLTTDGVITGVVAEGVLDQGQLEGGPVLGANAAGLLVRGSVWRALGGFDTELPSSVQGLEFCWRARLHGHEVVSQPRARLVHVEASTRGVRGDVAVDPQQERRRWGLALHEAYRPGPLTAAERGRLGGVSTRRVLGYLAGKDLLDAHLERRAVREYRADRASVERLRGLYAAAVGDGPAPDLAPLRLSRRDVRARRFDETFGRVVDWLAAFGDRGGGLGLDALTGDDFARDDSHVRRLSPTWILTWVLVVGALIASRSLFGAGPLAGPQLLSVPDSFGALWARWTAPVPGVVPSAGAPWTGLLWGASLPTFGHPDLIVGLLLLGAVPAAFLLARRVLGRLVDDRLVALGGALLYALVPVVSGAVGSGQLGTVVFTLLLPVAAHQLLVWWDDRDPAWPVVGVLALAATGIAAVEPALWFVVAAALVLLVVRERSGWLRAAVAGLVPVLLLAASPFSAELARHPGRLLTSIDPLLAPTAAPAPWEVLLLRSAPALPALWVSAVVAGALWLLALAGTALRPRVAAWSVATALGAATAALVLTRLVVAVPPTGEQARPQASAWLVLMAAALVWAAAAGLDGLRADIAERGFGPLHAAFYGAGLVTLAAVLVGSGWWVAAGHSPLGRGTDSTLPAFIRKDAAAGASRTLALELGADRVGWVLLEGDLLHTGDGERGLAFGGDPAATALTADVARRLASGSGDEQLIPDLQRLGVGYLWVTGSSAEQRAAISNAPGLGVGAADEKGANWTVPGSGRLVLVTDGQRAKLDPLVPIPAGPAGRTLVLAEPAAAGAPAVDGTPLERVAGSGDAPTYAVPAAGGQLTRAEASPVPFWAVLQGLGLLALVLLAAPGSRAAADARNRTPKRASRNVATGRGVA